MFEPFLIAPWRAQVAHVWIGFAIFLSWVSTLVTFDATMHTIRYTDAFFGVTSVQFNWQHPSNGQSFSNFKPNGKDLTVCASSGDGTLAFAIFAFFLYFPLSAMFLARIAGLNFPNVRDVHQSLSYEIILYGLSSLCFLIQVSAWGVCYTACSNIPNSSITGQGYGLTIACFVFQLLTMPLIWLVRSHPDDWMIGLGATKVGARSGREDGFMFSDPVNAGLDSEQSAFNTSSSLSPSRNYSSNADVRLAQSSSMELADTFSYQREQSIRASSSSNARASHSSANGNVLGDTYSLDDNLEPA